MQQETVIKVENISKRYEIGETSNFVTLRDKLIELPSRIFKGPKRTKTFWALKDVSFEVRRGEVVGIIGKNGAGKSTLLKVLARITEPTSGRITMHGRVASMLEVGTGFNPELTGRENIYLNGAIIGMARKEIDAKFADIVEFSGIGKFLDTPVKHYSSGMYVRLAFAVSAHLDSDILLVDEVLAVGDAEFQKKCLSKMTSLSNEGRTIVYVSHNLPSIAALCNQAIYMQDGKIVTIGEPNEILKRYYTSSIKVIGSKEKYYLPKGDTAYLSEVSADFSLKNKSLKIAGIYISQVATSNVNIGFSIHDEMEHVVAITYSGPSKLYIFHKGKNTFTLNVHNLALTPGRYTLRTRVEASGREIYWPKDAIAGFEISAMNHQETTRPEVFSNGQIILETIWR